MLAASVPMVSRAASVVRAAIVLIQSTKRPTGYHSSCGSSCGAAAGFGILFGFPYGISFAVTVALPAWWLAHLALLGRPVAHEASTPDAAAPQLAPQLEWYPVGRIELWISTIAALTTS